VRLCSSSLKNEVAMLRSVAIEAVVLRRPRAPG
jgi:hypothetical protein